MRLLYTVSIVSEDEGNGYVACVPDLPGCVTTGRTLAEVMDNIRDAVSVYLCSLEDERMPLPAPRAPEAVELEPGATRALLDVDTVLYRKMTDTSAVRKNVSLPAWMVTMAEARGLNCSQVLQEALRSLLT